MSENFHGHKNHKVFKYLKSKTKMESEDKSLGKIKNTETKIDNNPDSKFSKMKTSLKQNPWMYATIILGIVCIILLFLSFSGGITGNVISEDDMQEQAMNFFNTQLSQTPGTFKSIEETSGLYVVNVDFQGQTFPLYFTKDGKWIGQGQELVSISEDDTSSDSESDGSELTPQNVPKFDKPRVELFIWSYCPYGVQAQGPLAEVAQLLGDSASFESMLYYDGHGAFETQENKIQACIQEVAPDKYWQYAEKFVTDIYPKCGSSKDIKCDKDEAVKLMKSLGIDSTKVMSCVDSKGVDLIEADAELASELGVTGSPSLVVNGVKIEVQQSGSKAYYVFNDEKIPFARNPETYKKIICSLYNTAPSECDEVLSSSSSTATSGSC